MGDDPEQPLSKQNYETEIVKTCRVVGALGEGVLGASICFVPGLMISTIGCDAIGAILLGSAASVVCG